MPDNVRRNADLVPRGFQIKDLPKNTGIRTCYVCRADFFYDKTSTSESRRVLCGVACRNKRQEISSWLKRNGYKPSQATEYCLDPDKFDPIRPNAVKPTLPAPRNVSNIVGSEGLNILPYDPKAKVKREREAAIKARHQSQAAKANAEVAKINLQKTQAEVKKQAVISAQVEAIKEAQQALGLLPLSEQTDVLTGKQLFLPDTDIAAARAAINVIVTNNLIIAEKVLTGEITWTTTQVNLFNKLLSKVVPDAAADKARAPSSKPVGEMTIAELEDIVAKQKQVIPVSDQ